MDVFNLIIAAAPQVSLGPFQGAYERLLPLLIVFFVLTGMAVAVATLSSFLTRARDTERAGQPSMSFSALVHRLGAVAGTVILAVIVLTYGIDIINFVLELIFSVTEEVDV